MRRAKQIFLRAGLLLAMTLFATTGDAQGRKRAPRKAAPARPSPAAPLPRPASGDTTLRTNTLEILQVYKPQVRRAPRPQFSPAPPSPDTARVPQAYEVPQQALYYTYRSLPLRPLALGTDTARPAPQNFVRLGGGNLSTAFAEIGIGGIEGRDLKTSISGKYLSQTGNIAGQQTSLSDLQAAASWHAAGRHLVQASLGGLHNRYRFYGFDASTYPYDLDSLEQVFTGARFSANVTPDAGRAGHWGYKPAVAGSFYTDNRNATERGAGLDVPVSYRIDSVVTVSLGLYGSVFSYRRDDVVASNNLLQLRPAADIRKGQFNAHIGLTPSFGSTATSLLPDLRLSYAPASNIAFSAGWLGAVNQNTYEALTTRNPFLDNRYYTAVQTQSTEIFLEAATAFADHFKVRARAGLWELQRLPVFLNLAPEGMRFSTGYSDFRAAAFSADVRYAIGETFSVGGSGEWFHYYNGPTEHPWHEPAIRLRGDLQLQPFTGLRITGYIHALDGIYATNTAGNEVRLPLYLDLGAGADYVLIRQVGLFIRATNILSRRNERWQGYPAYKLGFYGGVSVRF